MKPNEFFFDPMKLTVRLAAAQVELARDMQTLMTRQLDTLAREGLPVKVKMTETPLPMPTVTFEMNETRLREMFHAAADANLAAWARMADVVSAMPGWAKYATRAPGEFWTGVFDKFSTLDAGRPANDVRAETVPSKPRTAAKTAAPAATVTKPAPKAPAKPKATKTAAKPKAVKTPKPQFLKAPKGKADDLTAIKGIGPKLSATLNELGVFHYSQIASWTPENCDWIDDKLAFKGRVQREAWVEQARGLGKDAA